MNRDDLTKPEDPTAFAWALFATLTIWTGLFSLVVFGHALWQWAHA